MAKKTCDVCGNPSGMYPLCKDCFKKRDAGEVEKCEECGCWYEIKVGHKCKSEDQPREKGWVRPQNDDYTTKVLMAEIPDDPDIRKKWEAKIRCDDGHYVRSKAEMIIDDYLYRYNYVHAYEKKPFFESEPDAVILSDFYIPTHDVYIEYWGLDNKKYKENQERKIKLYKDNKMNLIELTDQDIKHLDDILPRELFKYKK